MATAKAEVGAAFWWCLACGVVGVAVLLADPGAYFQDPALHFLRARWMWSHPWMLVDVWDRPAFTLLYSIPAALPSSGTAYIVAKLCTVVVTITAAWLTWQFARTERLGRAALVIPLMWLQPCVFLLCAEVTPEPLFAMLFALALVLRQRGRLTQSAIAVSLLILVRPEGIALAVLWAWCTVRDPRAGRTMLTRVAAACALALAPVVWWYLSAQITQDPLFIVHNWPPLSTSLGAVLTGGGVENAVRPWGQIVGVALAVPFVVGTVTSVWQRRLGMPVASVLTVLAAHLLAGGTGVFGWAPVPSAFVCVAPAIALITLAGWNALAAAPIGLSGGTRRVVGWCVAVCVLLVSIIGDVVVLDAQAPARDWRPIAQMTSWWSAHPRPIRRLIWSEAYADVLFGHDPTESALTYGDRPQVVALLTSARAGTLVVWDADIGPSWYGVTGAQIEALGFITLQHAAYTLGGPLPASVRSMPPVVRLRHLMALDTTSAPRSQEVWLLYRP